MTTCLFYLGVLVSLGLPNTFGEGSATDPVTPKQIQTAIDAGLQWLARNQVTEGPDAGGWGTPRYQTAVAGFSGLAFLANGHTPGRDPHGPTVDRAMRFVMDSMTPDGYLGTKDNTMYVHAIATLFGLSYLGRSEDPEREKELAAWCRKAIRVILDAQQIRKRPIEQGGWRYSPYSAESDLSVTSWQLLTLHAARQCGYEVPDEVLDAAMKYVNRSFMETKEGDSGFVYRVGVSNQPEPAVTGVALFMKGLFERDIETEKVEKSLAYIRKFPPGWGGPQYKGFFFFGTFYMVQGMFQIGDETWLDFSPRIQRVLLSHQNGDGSWDFPPDNSPQAHPAGRPYCTALGVLILSIDKQYLPMYQRQRQLF